MAKSSIPSKRRHFPSAQFTQFEASIPVNVKSAPPTESLTIEPEPSSKSQRCIRLLVCGNCDEERVNADAGIIDLL